MSPEDDLTKCTREFDAQVNHMCPPVTDSYFTKEHIDWFPLPILGNVNAGEHAAELILYPDGIFPPKTDQSIQNRNILFVPERLIGKIYHTVYDEHGRITSETLFYDPLLFLWATREWDDLHRQESNMPQDEWIAMTMRSLDRLPAFQSTTTIYHADESFEKTIGIFGKRSDIVGNDRQWSIVDYIKIISGKPADIQLTPNHLMRFFIFTYEHRKFGATPMNSIDPLILSSENAFEYMNANCGLVTATGHYTDTSGILDCFDFHRDPFAPRGNFENDLWFEKIYLNDRIIEAREMLNIMGKNFQSIKR